MEQSVERMVYNMKNQKVAMQCEVIAEGNNWIVTERPHFIEGKREADRYYVECNGRESCYVFENATEAILHTVGTIYGDVHIDKDVRHFASYAYAMLEGMPSYK